MQLTVDQTLQLAIGHHEAGRLQQAEALYRQILGVQPNHPEALNLLGVLALQAGRPDLAISFIRQVIAVKPHFAGAFNNLGAALDDLGRTDEAIDAYRQAVRIDPLYVHALNNLGTALRRADRLQQSVACFHQLIALNPQLAEAHCNLGASLCALHEFDAALAACRQAIALKPDFAQAYVNLGNVLGNQGALADAIEAYRRAVELAPGLHEASNNLGSALSESRQMEEAVAAFQHALKINPNSADTLTNLGVCLQASGRPHEAFASFQRAIQINPNHVLAHSNLLYALPFHPNFSSEAILEESRRWDAQHARALTAAVEPHSNDRGTDRRLRIGYVSPDFRAHVVGRNLVPLFREHDRRQFHITCYSNVLRRDSLTEQFQAYADQWRDIAALSDEQAAQLVRQDNIDILVDLSLHMARNRLLIFARKPAPIQITFAGYPGTTGLNAVDYRLTDPYLDPPGEHDVVYSEKSIRLPHSFWCYDPPLNDPAVSPLPALRAGCITFGCLNNFAKINETVLQLWAPIFQAIPNCRLRILAPLGQHRQQMLRSLGIDASRVDFVDVLARAQYLEQYHHIDICLDTFPYNGHTTSLDALWMGVPVITLCGKTVASRAGFSQMSNLGLQELVASTTGEFVRIATDLAADLPRLTALRATLRERMISSPLMGAKAFAGGIEEAYRSIWRRWCAAP